MLLNLWIENVKRRVANRVQWSPSLKKFENSLMEKVKTEQMF